MESVNAQPIIMKHETVNGIIQDLSLIVSNNPSAKRKGQTNLSNNKSSHNVNRNPPRIRQSHRNLDRTPSSKHFRQSELRSTLHRNTKEDIEKRPSYDFQFLATDFAPLMARGQRNMALRFDRRSGIRKYSIESEEEN